MKKLLNTLYISTPHSYISKENEKLVVRLDKELSKEFPIHLLESVVCIGHVTCSSAVMGLCSEHGVGLAFFSENGKFIARVNGPLSGNVLLRRAQYRIADDESVRAELARRFVVAKIANGRNVLLRALRDYPDIEGSENLKKTASYMAEILKALQIKKTIETVRGNEGDAARAYFSVFNDLIVAQKKEFLFKERSRRPPMDNVNALLSFVYTLLAHDTVSALEGVGLDSAVGYLHADRPGRPSLALDLMEEFRAMIADRLVLNLINRRQVKSEGFITTESGAVTMDDSTRKEVIINYQERKKEEIVHPFINERIPIGLLPHIQAMLLARYMRGDLDSYPPFRWK
jgi:CRISPR-associated protein Cas1